MLVFLIIDFGQQQSLKIYITPIFIWTHYTHVNRNMRGDRSHAHAVVFVCTYSSVKYISGVRRSRLAAYRATATRTHFGYALQTRARTPTQANASCDGGAQRVRTRQRN